MVNGNMYGCVMGSSTQVAFQLDDASLASIDAIAAGESCSRAEVLRTAVREMLRRRREEEIDRQLAAGYAAVPETAEELAFAEVSRKGLKAADLGEWADLDW